MTNRTFTMNPKFNSLIVLLTIFLVSCKTETDQQKSKVNEVDTLYFHETIFKDENGFVLPRKSFQHKSKTEKGLPRNEEIIMTLSYEGDYKELIKHATTEIYSDTKWMTISKIDNFHFKIFIDSTYADSTISMSYYLVPKKNYVMKVYYQDELVRFPEKSVGARFVQWVDLK